MTPLPQDGDRCEEEGTRHALVDEECDGHEGLAEAHLVAEEATRILLAVLTHRHPLDGRDLVREERLVADSRLHLGMR